MTKVKAASRDEPAQQTVERLHSYVPRLVRGATKTLVLYEAWSALNTESPERAALVVSPVTKALGVMWQATMDGLILSISRSLDPVRAHRVSYPVFFHLVQRESVLSLLLEEASAQDGPAPPDAQVAAVTEAIASMGGTLQRLQDEDPNRCDRLRAIRNRYLAHDLAMTEPVEEPIYENLRTMTEEVLRLAELATRIMEPSVLVWPRDEVRREVLTLVKVVGTRFPTAAITSA